MTNTKITEVQALKVLEVVDAGLVAGIGEPIPGQMCVEAALCFALGLPHGDDPPGVAPTLRALKISLNDAHWSSKETRAVGLRRLAVAQLGSAGFLDESAFVKRLVDYAIRVSVPKALRAAADMHPNQEHKLKLQEAANRCEVEGSREAADYAAIATTNVPAAYATKVTKAVAAYAATDRAAKAVEYAANAAEAAAYALKGDADYAAIANTKAADYAARVAINAAYAATTRAAATTTTTTNDNYLSEYAEAVVQILIDLKAPGCRWLPLTEAAR
jgi:hypothetical protein